MSALPSYRLRAVHLVAVWAYAVGQPVFSLLQANPEFLVVRGATRGEVIAFASILTFVPPVFAFAVEWLVSRVSRRAADVLHLVFLGAFLVPFVMLILKKLGGDSAWIVFAACVVAVAVVAAYVRWRPVRLLFTASVSLAAIGLVLFVARVPLVTEDVAGAQVGIPRPTPVVLVVLDELPVTSLTTRAGEIDRARYPNFARLARGATWFSRATTVHDNTTAAVPAILDGKLPGDGGLPTLAHHPENLFTLLGESYRLRVTEAVTYLCPKRYCPRPRDAFLPRLQGLFLDTQVGFMHQILPTTLSRGLPSVQDRWGGFEKERILVATDFHDVLGVVRPRGLPREQRLGFSEFLDGIDRGEPAASLHFLHVMLPHTPWQFFPSGRSYGDTPIPIGLAPGLLWSDHPWLIRQALQRHLLQVGYTDGLLGVILDKLERSGLYDDALVVVVADHGVSFIPGKTARSASQENIADIAPVPLFIKFPHQKVGRVDPRAARTIDILPTIADVLNVRVPWSMDGRSLLKSWVGPRTVSVGKSDGTVVQASRAQMERDMAVAVRRKTIFGPTWDTLLATGLPPQLVGLEIGSSRALGAADARVRFDNEELFAQVDLSSLLVPARITGTVEIIEIPPGKELVVAVNGRIVASTRCFRIRGEQRFSALVPDKAFRSGFNRVELFSVEGMRSRPRFIQIGHNGESQES
ncbi:MAG: sulfatase-like hydrolase/transferase [Actinobacteria bacterium]|nr:sulfatase-like hydrolase/transferase [Actinomycetota bacterium]